MFKAEHNELLTRSDAGTPLGEYFRHFWVPCMLASELPDPDGEPVRLRIMGEDLIAFRGTDGQVGVLDAYCPHRGAPLFFGRNEGCGLRCVYHGWKFDRDGRCVDMPNEPPSSTFKDRVRVIAYPVREAGGLVWIYMGPQEQPPSMPALEWLTVPAEHVYVRKYELACNYLQALEGDHDSSHVSALHSTLDDQFPDEFLREQHSRGGFQMADKTPKLLVLETEYGLLTAARRDAREDTYLWRANPWLAPFYSMIAVDPGHALLLNVRVPIDDENSLFFRINFHPTRPLTEHELASYETSAHYARNIPGTFRPEENLDNDYLIDREVQRTRTFSGIRSIPGQDLAVTERARPFRGRPGTVDRTREHLSSADAAIIKIRQLLLRGVRDVEQGRTPSLVGHPEAYRMRATALELPRETPFDQGAHAYLTCQSWDPVVPLAPAELPS